MTETAKLSIVIPVYNERRTIAEAVRRARTVELPVDREILIIDDGSTDGTREIIKRLADSTVRVLHHPTNLGKGAAGQAVQNMNILFGLDERAGLRQAGVLP